MLIASSLRISLADLLAGGEFAGGIFMLYRSPLP
jgi:hypothetical protein